MTDIRDEFLQIVGNLLDTERKHRRYGSGYEGALTSLQSHARDGLILPYVTAIEMLADRTDTQLNPDPNWNAALAHVRAALEKLNSSGDGVETLMVVDSPGIPVMRGPAEYADQIVGTTSADETARPFCLWHGVWAGPDTKHGPADRSCHGAVMMCSTPPGWYVPSYEGAVLTTEQELYSRGHARGWDDALANIRDALDGISEDRQAAYVGTRQQRAIVDEVIAAFGQIAPHMKLSDLDARYLAQAIENGVNAVDDDLELSEQDGRPEPPNDLHEVVGTFETVIGYEGLVTVDDRLIDCGAIDMSEWIPVLDLENHGELIGRAMLSRREATDRPDSEAAKVNEIVAQLVMYQKIGDRLPTFDITDPTTELRERGRLVDQAYAEHRFSRGTPIIQTTTKCRAAAVWFSHDPALCWDELPAEIFTITID